MTPKQFASYVRRIRLADDPVTLARIRAELDLKFPHGAGSRDSDVLVVAATLKRVRLLSST